MSGAEGASGKTARSDGLSCWANRPATCMAPRAWVKRLCSAVGNTQRADWSWGMRRRRWTQAVSIRSCSVVSPGIPPSGRVKGMYRWIGSQIRPLPP